jgi:hypothetical protein
MTLRFTFEEKFEKEIGYIISKNIQRILLNSRQVGIKETKDWKSYVSEETLLNVMNSNIDISESANLINFSNLGIANKLVHVLQKVFPNSSIQTSGYFHYPKTGYMSWHTNGDVPCKRLYITWAKEAKKSFFRYYKNNTVITDYDNEGLSFRIFDITDRPPYLWHCVGSETDRISFGFRII